MNIIKLSTLAYKVKKKWINGNHYLQLHNAILPFLMTRCSYESSPHAHGNPSYGRFGAFLQTAWHAPHWWIEQMQIFLIRLFHETWWATLLQCKRSFHQVSWQSFLKCVSENKRKRLQQSHLHPLLWHYQVSLSRRRWCWDLLVFHLIAFFQNISCPQMNDGRPFFSYALHIVSIDKVGFMWSIIVFSLHCPGHFHPCDVYWVIVYED